MNSIITIAALTGSLLLATSGVDRDKSLRLLEAQGLSNIILGENTRLGCSERHDYGTRFAGINHSGQLTTGVVCGRTWYDGIVVRLD